jgi:lincosamide nucleotidyltransferase B/F
MLAQEKIIERVSQLCNQDQHILAALMHGSFTKGEGDAYSDIEFRIYLQEDQYNSFQPAQWLSHVSPIALYFENEFGTHVVIFKNSVRGEFHFEPVSALAKVATWGKGYPAPENMLIVDRTGELLSHLNQISQPEDAINLEETILWHWHSLVTWILIGKNFIARGERARALEPLMFVQRYILWFARMMEEKGIHTHSPARKLEQNLSKESYAKYVNCTSTLKEGDLERAYDFAWQWGKDMAQFLSERRNFTLEKSLIQQLDLYFSTLANSKSQ